MGFKGSCIFVFDEDSPGREGQCPFPARSWPFVSQTGQLVRDLGLTSYELVYPKAVEGNVNPCQDELYIGAFEHGFALYSSHVFSLLEDAGEDNFRDLVVKIADARTLLGVALHNATELWACALWRKGQLIRAIGGSADDGVFVDAGNSPFPEEEFFAQASDHWDNAEKLVFAVSERLLGTRFLDLRLPLFEYKKSAR